MRPKDADEIRATGGVLLESIIRASINRSLESWAAYVGEDLLCVFGIRVVKGSWAMWVLTSVYVNKHPLTFWRASKSAVAQLREHYPLMWNMVHGKYTEALRWLEHLGFRLSPPEKFGPRGDLFCCAVLETRRIEVAHV